MRFSKHRIIIIGQISRIYKVAYEFDGNHFSIVNFRQIKTKTSRKRKFKIVYVKPRSSPIHASKFSQTSFPRKHVAVQSESSKLTKSSQTVFETKSKISQAYVLTSSNKTQTDERCFKTIAVQTDEEIPRLDNKHPLVEEKEADIPHEEVQTICFLNKIGEGLLSQNGLIQNNSTLLSKMADFMALLKEPILKQNDQPQIRNILLYDIYILKKSFKSPLFQNFC